jgi:flagellar hook-associated protein 3 FlgL
MMRISTASAFNSGVDTLTKRQTELSDAQERLTSGKRVAKASDDPAAAARAERALAGVMRSETSQRSVDASKVAMQQTESALADATDLMQEVRDTMVAGGNPTYSDKERASLAQKIKTLRDQLLVVANRSDGAGVYLFGGQGASQPPFVDAPGGVQYAGVAGHNSTDASTALPLTADGQAGWMSARTGNGVFETKAGSGVTQAWIDAGTVSDPAAITGSTYTLQFSVSGTSTTYAVLKDGNPTPITAAPYTPDQAIALDGMSFTIHGAPANGDQFQVLPATPSLTVFDVLDRAVAELSATNRSGAQVAQTTAQNLRDIDSVMNSQQSLRAATGEVLNRIDNDTSRLASQKLASQVERSDAEDLDMVQAISQFQNRQSGYEAALKSYSMVQRLTLFQYLNG